MQSAQRAAGALQATLEGAGPATRELSTTTLPLANNTLLELRRSAEALRSITEKIENNGAGSLIGGSKLPDYEP